MHNANIDYFFNNSNPDLKLSNIKQYLNRYQYIYYSIWNKLQLLFSDKYDETNYNNAI